MRILVLFSDPPELPRLRLDREDKLLSELARRFPDRVQLERVHASDLDDIHRLVWEQPYDVIHFSGHGSTKGLVLDKSGLGAGCEVVTAERLQMLLAVADCTPSLCLFLCCFSDAHLDILAQTAPFVITAVGAVADNATLSFVRGFYERFLQGHAIASAFENAVRVVKAHDLDSSRFRLHRRQLIHKGASTFVECTPNPRHNNSILINLDAVVGQFHSLGIPEEEFTHLIEKKLTIHYWIFAIPRDRCIIPIGRLLFGEFSWTDANDVVLCTRILRLKAETPVESWRLWHRLLLSYNDLASCPYRAVDSPASPGNRQLLKKAAKLFEHHAARFVKPAMPIITELGHKDLLIHAEFVLTHIEKASDEIDLDRLEHVVKELEQALTNYHEIVDGLQPEEETAAASE